MLSHLRLGLGNLSNAHRLTATIAALVTFNLLITGCRSFGPNGPLAAMPS
ncbi:MAG: hypothetical protein ABIR80_09435 [Opitutaceae bacterium]